MRNLHDLFSALARSSFRSRFCLDPKERAHLAEKMLPVILEHGRQFIREHLAPTEPHSYGPAPEQVLEGFM